MTFLYDDVLGGQWGNLCGVDALNQKGKFCYVLMIWRYRAGALDDIEVPPKGAVDEPEGSQEAQVSFRVGCKAQRALTEGNRCTLALAGDRVLLSGRQLSTLQETTRDRTFCVLGSELLDEAGKAEQSLNLSQMHEQEWSCGLRGPTYMVTIKSPPELQRDDFERKIIVVSDTLYGFEGNKRENTVDAPAGNEDNRDGREGGRMKVMVSHAFTANEANTLQMKGAGPRLLMWITPQSGSERWVKTCVHGQKERKREGGGSTLNEILDTTHHEITTVTKSNLDVKYDVRVDYGDEWRFTVAKDVGAAVRTHAGGAGRRMGYRRGLWHSTATFFGTHIGDSIGRPSTPYASHGNPSPSWLCAHGECAQNWQRIHAPLFYVLTVIGLCNSSPSQLVLSNMPGIALNIVCLGLLMNYVDQKSDEDASIGFQGSPVDPAGATTQNGVSSRSYDIYNKERKILVEDDSSLPQFDVAPTRMHGRDGGPIPNPDNPPFGVSITPAHELLR
ncbi:hypothetical protein DFH08DRAFT_825076 [Mycena albidolilacea]|uniref:Uncharacterized protein n=1 Tax=Mycena albidolilacea TaxID=1033008 RepID=A0AAD7E9P7_9AGAR|nr:hypothetical protein DFH08DRAFT_825076 [Mycena albidolilacea]